MLSVSSVRVVPRVFICLAFFNFMVGAILGGWMAAAPNTWSTVGPIHDHADLRHDVRSSGAVRRNPTTGYMGGLTTHVHGRGRCYGDCRRICRIVATRFARWIDVQAIASVLFLVNILSAVFSSRCKTRPGTDLRTSSVNMDTSHGSGMAASKLSFHWRNAQYIATDRVAQHGTDISLIIFIVGAWWMALATYFGRMFPQTLEPQGPFYSNTTDGSPALSLRCPCTYCHASPSSRA